MLIRLPFLVLGALGLPAIVLMSLAFLIAELRTGEAVQPMFAGLALCGLAMIHWLWSARRAALSDPRPTFLTRVARVVPYLMIPGVVLGIVLAIYGYDRALSSHQHELTGERQVQVSH